MKRTGNIRRNKGERRYHSRRNDEERRKIPETILIKKIIVTGDRNWQDIPSVVDQLKKFRSGTILVHGACRGADIICAAVAETLGYVVRPYPADWDRYKIAAGPIRNQQMLDAEHTLEEPIQLCLVFHNDIENSRGTADMLKRVQQAAIPYQIITSLPLSASNVQLTNLL